MCNLKLKGDQNMKKTYNQNQATPNPKETGTMSQEKKQPSHKAFAVENFTKDDKEKSSWTEIGVAWQHKDGKGFDVNIKLMPLSGRIVLSENNKET
jgi:hypothetical protein